MQILSIAISISLSLSIYIYTIYTHTYIYIYNLWLIYIYIANVSLLFFFNISMPGWAAWWGHWHRHHEALRHGRPSSGAPRERVVGSSLGLGTPTAWVIQMIYIYIYICMYMIVYGYMGFSILWFCLIFGVSYGLIRKKHGQKHIIELDWMGGWTINNRDLYNGIWWAQNGI